MKKPFHTLTAAQKRTRLDQWSFQSIAPNGAYTAPEQLIPVLCGKVYGHPNHKDGKQVTTSRVVGRIGEFVKTQSGSIYELGAVDPLYEHEFPNALLRLMNNLEEIQL